MLLLNFFYWCTNQQIIQRTFGAKNLAEGQKGVLLAAFFKILAPLILVLPGIVAAYLVIEANDSEMIAAVGTTDTGDWDANQAYGALVSRVLPDWLLGFFAAVVVGSILSTFNSVLNSVATLFSLDVYKKHISPNASTKSVVRSGQICSLVVGAFAVVSGPLIFHGQDRVFAFFQELNGVYFIPLLAIILFGMFNKWADERSALITLSVGVALMLVGAIFASGEDGWIKHTFGSAFHFMGAVFVLLLTLQGILGATGMKRNEPWIQQDVNAIDLTPWKPAPIVGGALVMFALCIYIYLAL